MNYSNENVTSESVIRPAMNSVSAAVCLLAAILVFGLKLHNKVVYRLALYQVLSSLTMATVTVFQALLVQYSRIYVELCSAFGYVLLYAQWMKLLFTMWVTFHLFCFAVLHKNLKKLEVLYVLTSLIVPAIIAVVPITTKTYGISPDGAYCYVYAKNEIAFVERLALWDGPAMIILIVASLAMIVMVLKLTLTVCLKSSYEPITGSVQFSKALRQLLPLAAFPVLFLIYEIPILIFHIYSTQKTTLSDGLNVANIVFFSLWSLTSGLTLIIHISVAQLYNCRKNTSSTKNFHSNNDQTGNPLTGLLSANSATHVSLPPPSI